MSDQAAASTETVGATKTVPDGNNENNKSTTDLNVKIEGLKLKDDDGGSVQGK